MSKQTPTFEGYADAEKLKDWFEELLNTIQSTADKLQRDSAVALTITITAHPQPDKEPKTA